MKTMLAILFLVIAQNAMSVETATQPDYSKYDVETVTAIKTCIAEAVADESGYELDESEVVDYCNAQE